MDLTPKLSRPWWTPIGFCCTTPSPSGNAATRSETDVVIKSRSDCWIRWLKRYDTDGQKKIKHAHEKLNDDTIAIRRLQELLNSMTLSRNDILVESNSIQKDLEEVSATKELTLKENELLRGKVAEVTAAKSEVTDARDKDMELKDEEIKNLQKCKYELLESNKICAAKKSEVELKRDEILAREGVAQQELKELKKTMNEISAEKDSLLKENELLRRARDSLQRDLETSTTKNRDEVASLKSTLHDSMEAKDTVIEELLKILESNKTPKV